VCNNLPCDLRSTDISLDTFKNKLKTFLFDADMLCEFALYSVSQEKYVTLFTALHGMQTRCSEENSI